MEAMFNGNLLCCINSVIKDAPKSQLRLDSFLPLQECFNSPYGTKFFPEYAEPIPGPSTQALSKAAKENSVYVVGGELYLMMLSSARIVIH